MSTETMARKTLPGVAEMFVDRWSPRAFSGEPVGHEVMSRIIEAARWAPSCFNAQPWRFYTSTPESFDDYLNLLMEGNQAWARRAGVIGFLTGVKHFDHNGKPNGYHAFDAGAAWMSLTLQARMEGLYSLGMGGIKKEEVATYLNLNAEKETVLTGFAIGRRGDPMLLDEAIRKREKPSGRKSLSEIWNHAP